MENATVQQLYLYVQYIGLRPTLVDKKMSVFPRGKCASSVASFLDHPVEILSFSMHRGNDGPSVHLGRRGCSNLGRRPWLATWACNGRSCKHHPQRTERISDLMRGAWVELDGCLRLTGCRCGSLHLVSINPLLFSTLCMTLLFCSSLNQIHYTVLYILCENRSWLVRVVILGVRVSLLEVQHWCQSYSSSIFNLITSALVWLAVDEKFTLDMWRKSFLYIDEKVLIRLAVG